MTSIEININKLKMKKLTVNNVNIIQVDKIAFVPTSAHIIWYIIYQMHICSE